MIIDKIKVKKGTFFLKKTNTDNFNFSLEYLLNIFSRPGIFKEHPVMLRNKDPKKSSYASNINDLINGLKNDKSIHVRNLERILDIEHPIVNLFNKIQTECNLIGDSISCFVTPPNSKALTIHHDENDIFTLQLVGSKKWELFQQDTSGIQKTYLENEVTLKKEFTTNKGNFFYIPKGTIHNVQGLDSESLSIAFIFKPILNKDIILSLINQFLSFNKFSNKTQTIEIDTSELNSVIENLQLFLNSIEHDDLQYVIDKKINSEQMKFQYKSEVI